MNMRSDSVDVNFNEVFLTHPFLNHNKMLYNNNEGKHINSVRVVSHDCRRDIVAKPRGNNACEIRTGRTCGQHTI